MKWYQLDKKELEKQLIIHPKKGLSEEQALKRRQQHGSNILEATEKEPSWMLFIKQFQDFMVLILLAATLIAGMLGEYIDALAIMVIVLLNGIFGFFQEHKAEKSLDKLKELSAPKIRVFRDKAWRTIPAEEAVIGDLVRLETGDRVPADIRIIRSNGLETEESNLTGESVPVAKTDKPLRTADMPIQEQQNMAFKSTLVTKGNGLGIVVQTGMQTAIGQIAELIGTTKKIMTPLERRLQQLGKILIYVVLFLTVLTVCIGVYHGQPLYDMFLAGVSLAVAVIPEGLPAIVTVALSLGVQRMIRRKAIVRKLSAVETLGCATVICTDKTGTITENKMTVQKMYVNDRIYRVTDAGYIREDDAFSKNKKQPNKAIEQLLLYGMLCNEANLLVKKGNYIIEGDPTDGALLMAARNGGLDHRVKQAYTIIRQFPFDSGKKRMGMVVEDQDKRRFFIMKGAPEAVLPRCTTVVRNQQTRDLTNQDQISGKISEMAAGALRMIAIAVKPLSKQDSLDALDLEQQLTFIGLAGLQDPPRKEVKQAIRECSNAGIRTVMITGDHQHTAAAIAKEIGLLEEQGRIMEGRELDTLSEDELAEVIEEVQVFARVTPEHKLKIVHALQACGHIVAMTGDGVNDAPAIKASNIGISMGRSGTDVTKEASSLILMDDNFNTIKEAIREGRNIYENIRKFIRYLLASNVGEIFVMLVAMLLSLPLPLIPVQILWVNLVTDGLPAMALGVDAPEKNVMQEAPRDTKEGIFSRGLGWKIISRGIMIGIVSLIAFMVAYHQDPQQLDYARTVAFATLVMAQLIHVFDCRAEGGIFSRNPFGNLYLLGAVLSSVALLLLVLYVDSLQMIFHTTFLSFIDWLFILVLSTIPTVLFGFSKK